MLHKRSHLVDNNFKNELLECVTEANEAELTHKARVLDFKIKQIRASFKLFGDLKGLRESIAFLISLSDTLWSRVLMIM